MVIEIIIMLIIIFTFFIINNINKILLLHNFNIKKILSH